MCSGHTWSCFVFHSVVGILGYDADTIGAAAGLLGLCSLHTTILLPISCSPLAVELYIEVGPFARPGAL